MYQPKPRLIHAPKKLLQAQTEGHRTRQAQKKGKRDRHRDSQGARHGIRWYSMPPTTLQNCLAAPQQLWKQISHMPLHLSSAGHITSTCSNTCHTYTLYPCRPYTHHLYTAPAPHPQPKPTCCTAMLPSSTERVVSRRRQFMRLYVAYTSTGGMCRAADTVAQGFASTAGRVVGTAGPSHHMYACTQTHTSLRMPRGDTNAQVRAESDSHVNMQTYRQQMLHAWCSHDHKHGRYNQLCARQCTTHDPCWRYTRCGGTGSSPQPM